MTGTAPDGGPHRSGPHADQLGQDVELEGLRTDLDGLDTRVRTLAEQVTELADQLTADTSGPLWVDWTDLDQEQASRAWRGLWVWLRDVLVPRYAPHREELPDCWTRHPGMRDELSWLWGTHRAAYSAGAGPTVVASWHLTYRDGVMRNVTALANRLGCRPGTCRRDRITSTLPPDNQVTSADVWLTDGINADLEARPPE